MVFRDPITRGQVVGVGGGTPSSTGHWLHPHLQIIGGARCKNHRAEGWGSSWGEGEDQLHGGESGDVRLPVAALEGISAPFVSPVTKGMEHLLNMKCKNVVPVYDLLLEMLNAHTLRSSSLWSQGLSATWRRTVRAKRAPRNPRLSERPALSYWSGCRGQRG